ncbi:MAG: hypothetical protein DCC57_25415 [Chloroflexi bacterium]|nr:MAG: hypothetical protein DCC57_25415 [Chloroflexota bacterium]
MPNTTVPNLYTLTVVDLSGIQDYVFGSNRLAENVGASALVEQATHQWPLKLVEKMARGRARRAAGRSDLHRRRQRRDPL